MHGEDFQIIAEPWHRAKFQTKAGPRVDFQIIVAPGVELPNTGGPGMELSNDSWAWVRSFNL